MKHSGKITGLRVLDVRFPTSLSLDGSDAMNPDPDYSAADVVLAADFLAGPPCRVGTLFHAAAHGRATFSFAYDKAWVARPEAFEIDPDLQLHSGESYPSDSAGVFRIFLDSAPDRWGRLLLDRREVLTQVRQLKRCDDCRSRDCVI